MEGAYWKLGKLGYAGIQGLINSGIAGGVIGITKWGEGFRNIIVGASLGLGESSISEIIEWWQSIQQTNMVYLRFAF